MTSLRIRNNTYKCQTHICHSISDLPLPAILARARIIQWHLEMAPLILIWRPVLHCLNLEDTCLCPPTYQGSARGQTTYLYSTNPESNRIGQRCASMSSLLICQCTAKSLGLAQNQGHSKSLNKYLLPDRIIKHQFCKWRKDYLHRTPFYHDSSMVKQF